MRYNNLPVYIWVTYLISMGMATNDNGFLPTRDQTRDVLADYGLPEHCATQDVTDGAVRGPPHLFQLKFCSADVTR